MRYIPNPIDDYEALKRKLVEELNKKVNGSPWVLIDYSLQNSNLGGDKKVGIYTHGALSNACNVIRKYSVGENICESEHSRIIESVKKDHPSHEVSKEGCTVLELEYLFHPVTIGRCERVFLLGARLPNEKKKTKGYIESLVRNGTGSVEAKLEVQKNRCCAMELEVFKDFRKKFVSDLEKALNSVGSIGNSTKENVEKILDENLPGIEKLNLVEEDFEELESCAKIYNDSMRLKRSMEVYLESCVELSTEVNLPDYLRDKIRYEGGKVKCLFFRGYMTERRKKELLGLSDDNSYKSAIELLFEKSRKLSPEEKLPSIEELVKECKHRLNLFTPSSSSSLRGKVEKELKCWESFLSAYSKLANLCGH